MYMNTCDSYLRLTNTEFTVFTVAVPVKVLQWTFLGSDLDIDVCDQRNQCDRRT